MQLLPPEIGKKRHYFITRKDSPLKTPLTLDSVGDLANGAARHIIDAALNTVASDLEDRGDDKKKRTVTITLEFCKLSNGDIDTTVQATPKVPAYKTPSTFAKLRMEGKRPVMVFQDDYKHADADALPGMESDKAE